MASNKIEKLGKVEGGQTPENYILVGSKTMGVNDGLQQMETHHLGISINL